MRRLALTLTTAAAVIAVVTLFASDMETEDDPCEWAENTQADGANELSEDVLDECPHLMLNQASGDPEIFHELYWQREFDLYRRQQEAAKHEAR